MRCVFTHRQYEISNSSSRIYKQPGMMILYVNPFSSNTMSITSLIAHFNYGR